MWGGTDGTDRDQGRHGEAGRRVGARRPGEGDPCRLRGEPGGARRPSDRPLPPPRPRPAHPVADVGARACASPRGRPRATRRHLERQPVAAGRGAHAGADRGRAGRRQPLRRPRAPRRHRRQVCGGGRLCDRALPARRGPSSAVARPSLRARRHGGRPRCDGRGGGPRVGAPRSCSARTSATALLRRDDAGLFPLPARGPRSCS